MRTIRPNLRRPLIALLAIAVNLPTLGAASTCAPARVSAKVQASRSCCARKAAETPPPCCCSRDGHQGSSTTRTAHAGCLCRLDAPTTPDQRREAPAPEPRTATDGLAIVAPQFSPLPTTTHLLATLGDPTPTHVPLYLGNARLRF